MAGRGGAGSGIALGTRLSRPAGDPRRAGPCGPFVGASNMVNPNLNSILVLPSSPTTIIGTGSTSGVQQLTEAPLIDSGNASWLLDADVQTDGTNRHCQVTMLPVPST